MSEKHLTSGAYIVRPLATSTIRLVEYVNPEVIFPPMIRDYFNSVGYMDIYPNFKTLRIGAIHPFALLLYQEVSGATQDVNLFPSITVADTSDTENYDTLGKERTEVTLDASDVVRLNSGVQERTILASAANMTRLANATANGVKIVGTSYEYRANHNIDLNIWGDNKDMVSLIYDLLKHFIIVNINEFHSIGLDIEQPIGGRRSGDINVEFGKLLYGANITVAATILTRSLSIDVTDGIIAEIDATMTPYILDEGGLL